MDEQKTTAIMAWLQPRILKELQRFLGFANYYHRFIRNFSQIPAPLTSLTRGKPTRITWTPVEVRALKRLKALCIAPVLAQSHPKLPVGVEVEASEASVGAVLIQRNPETGRRHACAYYTRKLTAAEHNYEVGDRELPRLCPVQILQPASSWTASYSACPNQNLVPRGDRFHNGPTSFLR